MNKVIFFGTSDFAAEILKHLIQTKKQVIAIVTQPDRPFKRSKKLTPPPVKKIALEICPEVKILQPEKASSKIFIEQIKELNPEIFIVVAYGQILRKNLLEIPKFTPINIHASLLPKYRGAAPIQRAIECGEKKTGITLMKMNEEMDAGEIILKQECSIDVNDTFKDVEKKLINISLTLVDQVLKDLEQGIFLSTCQNHQMATYAPKIIASDCQINWTDEALDIHNKIRSISPKPGAFTFVKIDNKLVKVKIITCKVVNLEGAPGVVLKEKPLIVACGKNSLNIERVQPENKKIMSSDSWINGLNKKEFTFT